MKPFHSSREEAVESSTSSRGGGEWTALTAVADTRLGSHLGLALERAPSLARVANAPTRAVLVAVRLLVAGAALLTPNSSVAQSSLPIPGENYQAKWWNITNGLPQLSINDLEQGKDGALWIATLGGLLRFDGLAFRSFDLDTLPGLDSNGITSLAADGESGIWFTTQGHSLLHLRDRKVLATFVVPGKAEILSLARALDGSLWTQASDGEVNRLHDGAWSRVLPPMGEGQGQYRGLCDQADGSMCVAAGRDLVIFEASGTERTRLLAPSMILSLAPAGDAGLWLGLQDGLARVREGAIERFSVQPTVDYPVYSAVEDGRGSLWLGTLSGPVCMAIGSQARRVVVHSSGDLPGGFVVRSMLFDREGNVWLGGRNAGLMRLQPPRLTSFLLSIGSRPVTALCSDGEGGAWVGRGCDGLIHVIADEADARPEALSIGLVSRACVHALMHDHLDRTWAGVNDTLMRREPGAGEEFTPLLGGRRFSPSVGPIVELPNGDVWVGTFEGQLVRIAALDQVREERDIGGRLHSLAAGPDGSLWIGGEGRVFHLRDGELTTFGVDAGIPPGSVRDFLPLANGDVWIASYGGGLALLSNGQARRLPRDAGLVDNMLSRILGDGDGRLWMLCNSGLTAARSDEILEVLAGRRTRLDSVLIGPEAAGINEASFGAPAGFRDAEDGLWFGMISGAVRVDTRAFPFNKTPPEPLIERVLAGDEALAMTDRIVVPAGSRRVVFEFTACALVAPERVRFRYQLEDFDESWIEGGGARSVSYTALWPGQYTFRVQARNEDGVWSQDPAAVALVVRPLWWQTQWFLGVSVAGVFSLLLALHRVRVRLLDRRAAVLLADSRERAEAATRESRLREELAHIGRVATAGELATSLAHEVNQPLAAIATNAQAGRRFLARDQLDRVEIDEILRDIAQEAQRASEVIRRLRGFLRKRPSDRRRIRIDSVVNATLPLVRRELSDNQVEIVLALAPSSPEIDADPVQLQQVLVNVIKNACEAMADSGEERRIQISTRAEGDRVQLDVSDTGPGIQPELAGRLFEPFVTTKPAGMGLGLAICRSIVEAHGGHLSVVLAPGRGTIFRIDLPAAQGEPPAEI